MDKSLPPNATPALTIPKRTRGRPKGSTAKTIKTEPQAPILINKDGSPRVQNFGFGGSNPRVGGRVGGPILKPWKEALNRAICQSDGKTLRKLADALVKKAAEGDVAALKEIGDRLDGRSVQQIEQKTDAVIRVFTDDVDL